MGADPERMLRCRERGLDPDFYLSLPEDVSSVKWRGGEGGGGKVSLWTMGAGATTIQPDSRWQSKDWNTQAFMWRWTGPPRSARPPQTKETKYQRVKVTDRQHICIRQDPIVEGCRGGGNQMAGLTCTLCHLLSLTGQQRLTDTLKLHLLVDIQETWHKLRCPLNPLPSCLLFRSPPDSVGPPAPRSALLSGVCKQKQN